MQPAGPRTAERQTPSSKSSARPPCSNSKGGLLFRKEATAVQAALKAAGNPYEPHYEQVSPDHGTPPAVASPLGTLTDKHFGRAYCDGRI